MRKLPVKKIFEDNKLELDLNFLLFEDTNQILEYSSVKNSTMHPLRTVSIAQKNYFDVSESRIKDCLAL